MFNLKNEEYNIKGTLTCTCGHEFSLQDMKDLDRINQPGFYGNIVKHYSKTKCPVCGKETILFLKQTGQTWKIIDIATKNEKVSNNIVQEIVKTVENKSSKVVEEEKQNSNEFICEVCGKVCKSQIGLNSHLKTHQN